MEEINYSDFVMSLAKPGQAILDEMSETQMHLMHMAIGVSGEAGELLDAIKKASVYQKAIDMENITEELGDIEFYLEGLRTALGISREETIKANIKKLEKRYKDGYSNKAAQERADKNVDIEWPGGPQPVEDNVLVEVHLRNGERDVGRADEFGWDWGPDPYDIVSYRVIL